MYDDERNEISPQLFSTKVESLLLTVAIGGLLAAFVWSGVLQ